MRPTRLRTPALVAVVLVVTFASGVLAGSGRGAAFNLGVTNTVSGYLTKLSGAYAGPMLQVVNTSTEAAARALRLDSASATQGAAYLRNSGGGPAANFVVNAGKAAFTVNSATKIANLNADQLDGLDSTALQRRVTGTCAPGSMVKAVNANGTVLCEPDDDTTYTGAHPIELSGGTIGLSTERCEAGSVYKYAERGWACAPDAIDGGDAQTLDGRDWTAFAASEPEVWHEIGATGEPAFQPCGGPLYPWWNAATRPGTETANTAAFYRDPLGRVHLKGLVGCDGGGTVFILPAGYRPAKTEQHATVRTASSAADALVRVEVLATGAVNAYPSTAVGGAVYVSLDGVTFRAAN